MRGRSCRLSLQYRKEIAGPPTVKEVSAKQSPKSLASVRILRSASIVLLFPIEQARKKPGSLQAFRLVGVDVPFDTRVGL